MHTARSRTKRRPAPMSEASSGPMSGVELFTPREIAAAVRWLTSSEEMGELFKVIAIHAPDWPAPAGFE